MIDLFTTRGRPGAWSEHLLQLTLFFLFFVPPLVFVPGRLQGQWIFVNYREPKLVAVQILAWLFLTVFWWAVWAQSERRSRLKAVFQDHWTWLLGLFLIYLCSTSLRALVIEASFYELAQYWTLFNLYLALVVLWQETTYLRTAVVAIVTSFILVTAIGLYQLWQPIPFLIPLPGPQNPSTMGYKNPAALAILGQIFLLFALISEWGREKRWGLSVFGGLVALAEVAYLATLQSRTSYFAFTMTAILAAGPVLAFLWRRRQIDALKVAAPLIVATLVLFGGILTFYSPAQKRVRMTLQYFQEPAKFLVSDRGIYLRNSVHMAQKNLSGVGIGNWGFAYPVHRQFQPKFLFNEQIQVSRAHGDYAQMLGETGWPGLLLWLALLGWALGRGLQVAWRGKGPWALLIAAQLVAFLLVMLFDYCIEMPYHKFAFFMVLAMVGALFLCGRQGPHLEIRGNVAQ